MDFQISAISLFDQYGQDEVDALLYKEGICRDKYIDYTVGIYTKGKLIAAGSSFHNVLKCIVVDHDYQGQGLTGHLVGSLMSELLSKGMSHAFLYTKPEKTPLFIDLGFYPLVSLEKVTMLENRRRGFADYLEELEEETAAVGFASETLSVGSEIGAVVMNANPFTRGHQYLLEMASGKCDILHVFVVEEDVSLFPFAVRNKLVHEGSAHLNNIVYHRTADYMISEASFPSYFLGGEEEVVRAHAGVDCAIFEKIAQRLHITKRFMGEEPLNPVTALYNEEMKRSLPKAGIDCVEIPRLALSGGDSAISATQVRKKYLTKDLRGLREMVPKTTYDYLCSLEKACKMQ